MHTVIVAVYKKQLRLILKCITNGSVVSIDAFVLSKKTVQLWKGTWDVNNIYEKKSSTTQLILAVGYYIKMFYLWIRNSQLTHWCWHFSVIPDKCEGNLSWDE
jgi:hypothetical protein